MLKGKASGQFKKDYKRCVKRGLNMDLLKAVVSTLAIPAVLPIKNQDHDLKGNYKEFKECHVVPYRRIKSFMTMVSSKLFQISDLCIRIVEFKALWETAPNQIVSNGNLFTEFFCIFQNFLINKHMPFSCFSVRFNVLD